MNKFKLRFEELIDDLIFPFCVILSIFVCFFGFIFVIMSLDFYYEKNKLYLENYEKEICLKMKEEKEKKNETKI